MGRTLFWYVFKDLLRIFGMTAGTLSAVMSFGGLLRPLTQHGLGLGQVGQMLAYFSPAMTAYALPIAALFAATVVYGRLSADNELTACRAGGVSLGPLSGMALPAAVFGVLVALLSLVLLCFVVPTYTLKVERVIYSNLAKLISNKIERTHEMRFGEANIFADRAYVPPPDPANPDRQRVVLEGVSIVQYERVPDKPVAAEVANLNPAAAELFADDNAVTLRGRFTKVPKEFLLASSATIEISEREDDQLTVLIALEGGTKFPREFRGGMQAGIEAVQFGPLEVPSPIKEDPKFMDVERLRELYKKPEKSRKIQSVMGEFIRRDQVARSVNELVRRLGPSAAATQPAPPRRPGRPAGAATQPSPGDSALVDFGAGRFVELRGANGSVIRISVDPTAPGAIVSPEGDEVSVTGASPSTIWFERIDPPPAGAGPEAGTEWSVQAARALRIRVRPDQPRQRMHLTVELLDRSPGGPSATRAVSGNYSSVIEVPMPPEIRRIADHKVADYVTNETLHKDERHKLTRELTVLDNNILAEAHGRGSFALSCLIMVLVGATLGMMFKSGNFLTAFAVSFVPALICITLIVAGQQTCHAVPFQPGKKNPLELGLALIWSGNAINAAIAAGLTWKLLRQ